MTTTRTLILAALALAAALRAAAQLAYTFDAECSRPAQHDIPVMRGESVTVAPRLVLRGAPVDISGMAPSFWYQTNGMADAWWSLPAALDPAETGRVSAVWSHTNDLGAAAYNWFIGLSQGGTATTYRAAGRIVMRHAPGFTPNAIPLPVPVLDFSAITITNAPWVTAADCASGSNALASAVQDLSGRIDALPPPPVVPVVSVNGYTGAVSITAASLGALTAEADLAALRTYHYGSPDIVESPAEWFVFDVSGTITAFNWEAGRENVVIPWAIGGVPVTAIGARAFQMGGIVSVIAPQTVTVIGDGAFANCPLLVSVSLPQVRAVGDYAFASCTSLASVSLPQAQTIGDDVFAHCISLASVSLLQAQTIGSYAFYSCHALAAVNLPQATSIGGAAFYSCHALAAVNLPQVTSIGDGAFFDCGSLASVSLPQAQTIGGDVFAHCISLTSVHMGRNAPAEAEDVFAGITPPPTVYVTDPQATGWGAEWNGAPVVRLPLYGSNVTAQAYTLNGDTITEWPAGGTPGAITNGQEQATLGGMVINGNAVTIGTDAGNSGSLRVYSDLISKYDIVSDSIYGAFRLNGSGKLAWHSYGPSASGLPGVVLNQPELHVLKLSSDASSGIADLFVTGSVLASETNTAAVVRSTGGYIIGPTISGKQAHIFTDGTNCYFVSVNSVTNDLTANLAVSGWLALPQSQPTNLIMRLVASNDVIMAIGVIQ